MAFHPESIPQRAKDLHQWDCYKLEEVNGQRTKVPYNPSTSQRASSTDLQTWVSFGTAQAAYSDLELYDGICFFLTAESGLVFIDLDNAIVDGVIESWAMDIVEQFSSYTEISQSGKGLHILIARSKPGSRCSTSKYPHKVEIYDHARQCCLTGDVLEGHSTIEPCQDALNELYRDIFGEEKPQHATPAPGLSCLSDQQVIQRATLAKNGNEFKALWDGSALGYGGDDSAADLGLMNHFAFYCCGDRAQMERLFSASALGQRDKWISRQDYRRRTIEKALEGRTEFYKPRVEETEEERHRREFAEANPPLTRERCDVIEAETGVHIFNAEDDPKQNEISEEEASKYAMPSNPKLVLNLEKDNFLSQYVAYGNELSDAYPDYFFMNGLEMLAIINDRKTYVHLGVKKIYPNVYINQLGASTTAHKSTAMDDNEACIEELNDGQYHSAPSDGSPEGWLEGMAEDGSHAYCNQDEVANYLARMHKHDYMAGMTDILNKVFDGATINKRNARKKGNQPSRWTIKDPYYNQLYATTAEKFSFVTTSMDVHSGFWVRFLHSYPNYDRDKFTPLREASDSLLMLQQRIIGRLRSIQAEIAPLEDVKVKIEPEGWKLYEAWQIRWNRRLRKTSDDYIKQIIGRYTVYVLKLGMLFTMGRVDFDHTNIVISAAHIKTACELIDEYFVPHALAVRELIGEGAAKDTNLIVKIESVLRVNGGQIVHRLLLKKTKVSAKQLDEALDTMVKSGTIDIKIVKNPRGRATEKIFLRQDDESIMSILSTTEGQYENRDNGGESKKVKVDIIKGKDIVKPLTATHIRDDTVDNVPIVSDVLENGKNGGGVYPPVSQKGDNMKIERGRLVFETPKRGQYETSKQRPQKNGNIRDNMGDNIGSHPRRSEPTPSKPKEDSGFQKFKAGMKKRTCLQCGEHFSYDLGIHYNDGYICAKCHREGPPTVAIEPPNADAQIKFSEVASAN